MLGALGKRECENGIEMLQSAERQAVRGQAVQVVIGAMIVAALLSTAASFLPCI